MKIIGASIAILLFTSAFGTIVIGKEKTEYNSTGNLGLLAFSPKSHHFGDKLEGETDSTTFEVWRSGGCCALEYTLSWSCSWVNVFPTSGVSHGEHDVITVNIDTTGLIPGTHICNILIESFTNGGSGTFTATVNVIADYPVLSYSPSIKTCTSYQNHLIHI